MFGGSAIRGGAAAAALALASVAGGGTAAAESSAQTLYVLRCSGCHGVGGDGSPAAGVPSFPGFIGAFAADPEGRLYMTHVPGVAGSGLDDAEIAAVLNYIVDSWAGSDEAAARPFTPEEVGVLRAESITDVVALRRAIAARLAAQGVAVADYPWP